MHALSSFIPTPEVSVKSPSLFRLLAIEVFVLAALAIFAIARPAHAEGGQPECPNLPTHAYRGVCQTQGQPSACLASDTRYCLFSPVELNCFSGWCSGDN